MTLLVAGSAFAEEKQGGYGTLPPASVQERIEDGTYNLSQSRTIPGQWIQDASSGRWWYRHDDGTYTKNDWEQIGDKWYHFDSEGWMQTGWFTDIDGKIYYLDDKDGFMRVQWLQVGVDWYYFDAHGVRQTGWVDYNNSYYYCDLSTAKMYSNQWKTISVDFGGVVRALKVHFTISGAADFASEDTPCSDLYYTYNDHVFTVNKDNLTFRSSSKRATDSILSSAHSHWSNKTGITFNKITGASPAVLYTDATLSASTMAVTAFPPSSPGTLNWGSVTIKVGQNYTQLNTTEQTKVIEHEMGHALGMSHRYSKKVDSVMFAFAGIDQSHVSTADVTTYNHLYN